MRVTRLKLLNVRAIEIAEFHFRPGFNLVVGVNGVGKATILDSLSFCLSHAVKDANKLQGGAVLFDLSDIRMGADALDVVCQIAGIGARSQQGYALCKTRGSVVPQEGKSGMPREQVYDTPDRVAFVGKLPPATGHEPGGRPLAILFSMNRATPSSRMPPKSVTAGGIAGAFANALRVGSG